MRVFAYIMEINVCVDSRDSVLGDGKGKSGELRETKFPYYEDEHDFHR